MIRYLTLLFLGLNFFQASAQQRDTLEEVTFTTLDGINISASYGKPTAQEFASPAIIMIHQGGSSREEWLELGLVNQLLSEGYAVLTYDVRIHGKSGMDDGELGDLFNNPDRAPLDLQAALQYLEEEEQIDAQRIGIIGASIGANLACVAASSTAYNVQTVVAISAKVAAVESLSGMKQPLTYKNAFYIASEDEQEGKRKAWANEFFAKTSGNRAVTIAPGDKHGAYILRESTTLQDEVVAWFVKTL